MSTVKAEPELETNFVHQLLDTINGGALCLMISIGHKTGLFECMAGLKPSTSSAIAEAANLNERYVREWLNAMTVGKVCVYNEEDKTYFLPEEHAKLLTAGGGTGNMAVITQFIAMLGTVESKIVDCFKNGGGVGYEHFDKFHEIMAEESGQSLVPNLVDNVLPIIEGIDQKLKTGIKCSDIGCGMGRAIRKVAERYPESTFVGYDLSEEAIKGAGFETKESGLENVSFEQKDVSKLDVSGQYDLITAFDAIHDQAKPDVVLSNIYNALKPGGVFLMQDINTSKFVEKNMTHPASTFVYSISTMHCMTVSLAQGGAGLGAAWGVETAEAMLRDAGFAKIEIHNLEHDPMNSFFVATK